jgi:hypothetical protein
MGTELCTEEIMIPGPKVGMVIGKKACLVLVVRGLAINVAVGIHYPVFLSIQSVYLRILKNVPI